MNYTIKQQQEIQVVAVNNLFNEFDNHNILESVNERIKNGAKKIVIDLKNLKYLNSAGLNFLIAVLTKSRKVGGDTVIANVGEDVSKLLVITKLKQVFSTADTVTAAKQLFASQN